MTIYKTYYLLLVLNILILPILLFSASRQHSYFTNEYATKIMRVEKCTSGSSSKRKSVTVEGKINKKQVFFGLFDGDAYDFFSYLDDSQQENLQNIDYNNLKSLKLDVRVVQFDNSKNVLYIKKNQTAKEALEANLFPWIAVEIAFSSLLLLFYFLKTRQKQSQKS